VTAVVALTQETTTMSGLCTTYASTTRWSLLALAALAAGCTANAGDAAERPQATSEAALTLTSLPTDPAWPVGLSPYAIAFGLDDDGAPLYACRGSYKGSVQVGKTRSNWSFCDFGYNGAELQTTDYQTLVSPWIPAEFGVIPAGAFPLGSENGQPLYACRAFLTNGSLQLGKIRPGFPGCDVPYGGVETTVSVYAVLGTQGNVTVAVGTTVVGAPPPADIISGGTDGDGGLLYPCSASYAGTTQVGKVRRDWSACDIPYGGHEIWVPIYSILRPYIGSRYGYPALPANVLIAGTDTNQAPLGICVSRLMGNGKVQGSLQVGKYIVPSGTCSYPYGSAEVPAPSYAIGVVGRP
jgi:hypothetical protein